MAATKWLAIVGLLVGAGFAGLLVVFRHVDPPASTLMLVQMLTGKTVERRWVPLDAISPSLIHAVVASEDGQFCTHRGVDFRELEAAYEQAEQRGDENIRGASTITMQVVKNQFLWPSRSLFRKAVEIPAALAMELVWSKRRIMEVYLNIAEWGPGVFGAEAAARYHFRKSASRLTPGEAALLAVALPNPIERAAGKPGPGTRRLAALIEQRIANGVRRTRCLDTR